MLQWNGVRNIDTSYIQYGKILKYTDVLSLNSIESSAHQLTEECFAILPTDD